ncbi:MAG: RNA polymerase sigma factor [Jatrophihabitans sp.]
MTADRDEAWFEDLYRCWHPPVLAYARRRVAEPHDLVAEVFTAAWRHRQRVTDPPLPWLLRTARNYSMHFARADRRRDRLSAKVASGGRAELIEADPTPAVDDRQDSSAIVLAALATLSRGDQELLRLVAWERLNTAEAAYVLECSEAAVRVRIHRAKRRLAAAIGAFERSAGWPASTESTVTR